MSQSRDEFSGPASPQCCWPRQCSSPPASAQDANIRSVTTHTVKPDRVADFQAEIKEYNAVLAKAGSDRYSSMWVPLTGDHEFARVQLYTKWADLDATIDKDPKLKDQAADLARISLHIIECTSSWRATSKLLTPSQPARHRPRPAQIDSRTRYPGAPG